MNPWSFQSVKKDSNRQNKNSNRASQSLLPGEKVAWRSHDGCGVKTLATQEVLTYCTTRTLTYPMYADESGLFVFESLVTSVFFV